MNTNKQIKSFKESASLNFEESNQFFNKSDNKATSALMKSQREISGKTNNSIKGNGLVKGCNQTKDTTPGVVKSEINRLAEAWCELLLRQIQEEKTQQSIERAISKNTGENINRDLTY